MESKKALPKEPRLGYYNSGYSGAPFYGGNAGAPLSPPGGPKNFYAGGPGSPYQGYSNRSYFPNQQYQVLFKPFFKAKLSVSMTLLLVVCIVFKAGTL